MQHKMKRPEEIGAAAFSTIMIPESRKQEREKKRDITFLQQPHLFISAAMVRFLWMNEQFFTKYVSSGPSTMLKFTKN